MLIKRYIDFISEAKEDFNSIGEWVESLSQDFQIKNIINKYLTDDIGMYGGDDLSPEIRLANAINLLSDRTKKDLEYEINNYLQVGIEEKEPTILASTDTSDLLKESQNTITISGRGIFVSFLKSLTALGLKDVASNVQECPDDLLVFYLYKDLDVLRVSEVFSRFRSLERYNNIVNSESKINLYFGITTTGQCEYGIFKESRFNIGQFKLNKSTVDWMMNLNSKSLTQLKQQLNKIGYSELMLLGQIKNDINNFTPGYVESKLPTHLQNGVLTTGYYGVGKWDNGRLDEGELENIKTNFVNWLMTKKWGDKVLISLKANSFWLYIHVKLK